MWAVFTREKNTSYSYQRPGWNHPASRTNQWPLGLGDLADSFKVYQGLEDPFPIGQDSRAMSIWVRKAYN